MICPNCGGSSFSWQYWSGSFNYGCIDCSETIEVATGEEVAQYLDDENTGIWWKKAHREVKKLADHPSHDWAGLVNGEVACYRVACLARSGTVAGVQPCGALI